jgi:hypothetical protein
MHSAYVSLLQLQISPLAHFLWQPTMWHIWTQWTGGRVDMKIGRKPDLGLLLTSKLSLTLLFCGWKGMKQQLLSKEGGITFFKSAYFRIIILDNKIQ